MEDKTNKEYEIDPLANITPEADERIYKALKSSIKSIGQLVPLLLRNGKIVDGRHRYKACMELGIEPTVEELGNISDKEVMEYITAKTIVKNKTAAQRLIEAYNIKEATGKSYELISNELGVGSRSLKDVGYLANNKPELVAPLFKGDRVEIYNHLSNNNEMHNTISTIVKILKANVKAGKEVKTEARRDSEKDHWFDINDFFLTNEAKDFFWERYNRYHFQLGCYSTICWDYVELANNKYPPEGKVVSYSQLLDDNKPLDESLLTEEDIKLLEEANYDIKGNSAAVDPEEAILKLKKELVRKRLAIS